MTSEFVTVPVRELNDLRVRLESMRDAARVVVSQVRAGSVALSSLEALERAIGP